MKGDEGRQGGSGSQEQARMEIMKGDKAGAASLPFSDFGDRQLKSKDPIASSYLGKNDNLALTHHYMCALFDAVPQDQKKTTLT